MIIDASRLQITVQEEERWRRRMSVTVPATVVREEEQRATRNLASRAKLKGFRKGRVPASVIQSRFGSTVRRETIDRLIGDAYRHALAAEELEPISEGELEEVFYEPDQDLVFSIAFDVRPQVQLGRLGGFVVERPKAEVKEEHVQEMLERIREQNGAWTPADKGKPQDRDLVSVRIRKLDDEGEGRGYELVLGQGDAIPDVEEAIRSLEPGQSGEFDVRFPDDFPDESRRGQSERIEVELLNRKELVLPELDDDLARQVGDFDSLDELRARVREDLQNEAREQAESVARTRLLDVLLEANPFEVPRSMVDRYVDAVIGEQENLSAERRAEVRSRLAPEAERAVKRIMLIDLVADSHGLAATQEEVDARVDEIAARNDTTPARVRAELNKTGRLEGLRRDITEKKVFAFLLSESEVTEAPA